MDPWCDPADVAEQTGCSSDQAVSAATSATLLLWRLTGRAYGTSDIRLRPTGRRWYRQRAEFYGYDVGWGLPLPLPSAGPYLGYGLNFSADWWASPLGWFCGEHLAGRQLELPPTVSAMISVEEDGTGLDPSVWRLDPPNRLVRLDGSPWRHDQDLTLAAGAAGTWSVSLTVGRALPGDAADIALELAVEFAKDLIGKTCRLPQRVTQVTKQGATFLLTDPAALLDKGIIGLPRVDRFIVSLNPNRLMMPSQVYIPGEDEDDDFRQVLG